MNISWIGRQTVVAGVRTAGVVKAGDIGEQALLDLLNGLETTPAQLLFFQILKKHSMTALS